MIFWELVSIPNFLHSWFLNALTKKTSRKHLNKKQNAEKIRKKWGGSTNPNHSTKNMKIIIIVDSIQVDRDDSTLQAQSDCFNALFQSESIFKIIKWT